MIWHACLSLSMVSILVGLIIYLYKKRTGKSEIKYLGAGVYLAAVIACFPVNRLEESWGFALIMSISHAIRMFVVDTGIGDITEVLNENLTGSILVVYKMLVSFLYISGPVFTIGLVLNYFSNFFERLRLAMRWKRDMFLFSELNQRSVAIAENIVEKYGEEKKKPGIVFCKSDEKDDENCVLEDRAGRIGAVFTQKVLTRMTVKKKTHQRISYFAISENQEENLNMTLDLIDARRQEKKEVYVYCFSQNTEAEILIDSKEKGNVRVVLFDQIRETVYDHLFRHPLYGNQMPEQTDAKQGKISLLIVGGGKVGTEFLKAAAWYGQMNTLDLEIHVIDLKGNIIQKKLAQECPELLSREEEISNYPIHIYKSNIFSYKAERLLDQIGRITYCVVALGSEEENIHAGVHLRRYFSQRESHSDPIICAYIQDGKRQEAVWNMCENTRELKEESGRKVYDLLKNDGRIYYNIIPFGDTRTMFGRQSDASFLMEYLALGIHCFYWNLKDDADQEMRQSVIRNFYGRQYNRRSSQSNGMHMKVKLWEMGYGLLRVPTEKAHLELFRKYVGEVDYRKETEGKRQDFYGLEHIRWMAFMRTEGWRLATEAGSSLEEIRSCYQSYFAKFRSYDPIRKLHPALVPIETEADGEASMKEVNDMIAELNSENSAQYGTYNPGYQASDMHLIDAIGDIVNGHWCGSDSLRVRENKMSEGACQIASLSDMVCYHLMVYLLLEQDECPQRIFCLREIIKYCCIGVLRNETSSHREKAEAYWGLGYMAKAERQPLLAEQYRQKAEEEGLLTKEMPRFDGFGARNQA